MPIEYNYKNGGVFWIKINDHIIIQYTCKMYFSKPLYCLYCTCTYLSKRCTHKKYFDELSQFNNQSTLQHKTKSKIIISV